MDDGSMHTRLPYLLPNLVEDVGTFTCTRVSRCGKIYLFIIVLNEINDNMHVQNMYGIFRTLAMSMTWLAITSRLAGVRSFILKK